MCVPSVNYYHQNRQKVMWQALKPWAVFNCVSCLNVLPWFSFLLLRCSLLFLLRKTRNAVSIHYLYCYYKGCGLQVRDLYACIGVKWGQKMFIFLVPYLKVLCVEVTHTALWSIRQQGALFGSWVWMPNEVPPPAPIAHSAKAAKVSEGV